MKEPVRINSTVIIGILIPLVMFGGIGLSIQQGWWKTSGGSRAPAFISRNLASNNLAGGGIIDIYDPEGIRGNSTFGEIETYFGVEATLIAQAFGIHAENPRVITAKFVDSLYGEMTGVNGELIDIGTDSVKFFVSRITGIPFTPEEKTGLPESAIEVILSLGPGMTEEQRLELFMLAGESRTTRFEDGSGEVHGSEDSGAGDFVWQGRTTFGDVMARGVSLAQIEAVLGMELDDRSQSVRDFSDKHGLQYSQIRTALSGLMGQ